jgi:hypothetical protein
MKDEKDPCPDEVEANFEPIPHPQSEVTAVKSDLHRPAYEIREIDFVELADGSLVEMIEDPADSSASCLAVRTGKEIRITNELESAGKRLTSISRNSGYMRNIVLPKWSGAL